MNDKKYKTPVVLWESEWKQVGTSVKTDKHGNEYKVIDVALYGTPNKEYKGSK